MKIVIALVIFTLAANVFADAPEWTVETGDFQTRIGTIERITADSVEMRVAEKIEAVPMRELLRCTLRQAPATPVASEPASAVDIRVNQIIRIFGVDMTVASTSATLTTLNGPDGQTTKPMLTSDVRQVLQANAKRSRRGPLALELNNGDRLFGGPVKIDGSQLIWDNELLGSSRVPLEKLARLTRSGSKIKPLAAAAAEDTVVLGNGDTLHGIMSNLTSGTLTIQTSGGGTNAIPLDSVQFVGFAQTSSLTDRPAHAFVLGLIDGSQMAVESLASDGRQWTIARFDGARQTLSVDSIREIEQVGGPVIWLSDLKPSESSNHSYLGRDWPPQFGRAVDGGPLRFQTRQFKNGIGVHAYSKLTFEVPNGFDRLHLNYAIDGDGEYADVTVRVLLDGKPALQAEHVRAGTLATPPIILLDGAKQIALEVDFGDNQDVQDRFNWIEPALLRMAGK